MSNKSLVWAGIILAVLAVFGVGFLTTHGGNLGGGTSYNESNLVGDVYQGLSHTLMMQNGVFVGPITTAQAVKVGTNGTSLAGIKTGSCTIWAPATTIAASTTQQVECQGATDGSISRISGITSDSTCVLTNASSTNTVSNSIVIAGQSASSTGTSGSIVARISNLTGGTFTWSSTASSSAKWKYLCVDPS